MKENNFVELFSFHFRKTIRVKLPVTILVLVNAQKKLILQYLSYVRRS